MEAAYRNDGTQVANLFKEKHPGHFCVYNLTERKYDTTMFEGRVRDFALVGFSLHSKISAILKSRNLLLSLLFHVHFVCHVMRMII